MYKKAVGLSCLLFTNILMASSLYIPQLTFSNKTSDLTIKFPMPGREEGMPIGPTDATVIDNTFVVLDSYGSKVSFFDSNGTLLKSVPLPKSIQFQNIVRDKDNSLFVLGTDTNQTKLIHIQNEVITEETVYKSPVKKTNRYIDYILPDDYGLIMIGSEVSSTPKINDVERAVHDRIDRNCISCPPQSVKGAQVRGVLYHITSGQNSSLFIGDKEIPLKLYPKFGLNSYEIIQIDQDGTAWINNNIMINDTSLTYVWKVNKEGKVLGIYRFASDTEFTGMEWLMKRQIIVSNEGKVYGLTANKKQFKFLLLTSLPVEEMKLRAKQLDPALFKKKEFKSIKIQKQSEYIHTLGCKSKKKAIDDAYDYMQNKIYLSTSSIKNDASCPKRTIPSYLLETGGKAQTYDSVSYNWGGFDTIAEFNKKITTNKMKAGNVNDKSSPLLSCTAGVDCSGYVSRALGLTSKLGTWDIASNKISEEIDWFQVEPGDLYINPGVHVVLLRMKSGVFGDTVYIAESNAEKGRVIEQKVPISWLKAQKLLPRRVKNHILCK